MAAFFNFSLSCPRTRAAAPLALLPTGVRLAAACLSAARRLC